MPSPLLGAGGRAPYSWVLMATTRSRSGQPRNHVGRFIKGKSQVEETGSVKGRQQVAAAELVAPLSLDQQGSAELKVVSGAVNEVSEYESDENSFDSSSADSDFGIEEDGKSVERQDLCSTLLEHGEGLVAQQVFVEMSNSDPVAAGVNLGDVSSARVAEKGVGSEQKAPWVNLFKDNRNFGNGYKLEEVVVEGDLSLIHI